MQLPSKFTKLNIRFCFIYTLFRTNNVRISIIDYLKLLPLSLGISEGLHRDNTIMWLDGSATWYRIRYPCDRKSRWFHTWMVKIFMNLNLYLKPNKWTDYIIVYTTICDINIKPILTCKMTVLILIKRLNLKNIF